MKILMIGGTGTISSAITRQLAAAGHDCGSLKADKKVYDKLPGCCKYRDNDAKH